MWVKNIRHTHPPLLHGEKSETTSQEDPSSVVCLHQLVRHVGTEYAMG